MEYETQSVIQPLFGITNILIDAINEKYNSISNFNSIKVTAMDEGYEDISPVINSIIEDENNHIGKLQQLVDLLSGGEDAIAEGKAETIELIDNPEIMESMVMAKKLKLNENFDNVIDDVQAVADPVFVGANEEHDENKKNFDKAIKENEKAAEETIPKEGDTGKDVKSVELKKMKLSESNWYDRYSPELSTDFAQSCADDVAEYMMTEFVDLSNTQIRQILRLASKHFNGPDFEESLQEAFDPEKKQEFLSAVYNALAEIAFKFDTKYNYTVDENLYEEAFEWFSTHFFNEDGSFNESLNEEAYTRDELKDKFGTDDLDIINAGNEEDVALKEALAAWYKKTSK